MLAVDVEDLDVDKLKDQYGKTGAMLNKMIQNAVAWCKRP